MAKNSFIFNTNKCVGCNACAVGCSIENGTDFRMNWREVNTGNKIKHPGLPVFHFSLACNHCEDAPCMKNCPALAYSRDEKTGAVIHHAEACIGCTYCTWACPYDAPKFNSTTKIVEKCNFCVDRISQGIKPACVQACPVGALEFDQIDLNDKDRVVPGFIDQGIKPCIQLVPLRETNISPAIKNIDQEEIDLKQLNDWLPKPKEKVSLKKEWTLVLFTLSVASLLAWQAAYLFGYVEMQFMPFALISFLAIALTSLHIGKKMRMWRFILNLKGSWLSREIFSFSGFLGFTALQLLTSNIWMGYAALVFGIFAVISVDMVYQLLQRKDGLVFHSAMVSLSALLLFFVFTHWYWGLFILVFIKWILYVRRKQVLRSKEESYFPFLSILRILLLLIAYYFTIWHGGWEIAISFGIFMAGEIIDRSEFYLESDVITPEKKLRNERI